MTLKLYLVIAIIFLAFCIILFPFAFCFDQDAGPIATYVLGLLLFGVALFLLWFFEGLSNEEFHPLSFAFLVICAAGALFGWLSPFSILASLPMMGFGLWLGLVILKQDQVLPATKKHLKRLNYPPSKKEGVLIFCGEFVVMALIIGFFRHCRPIYQALVRFGEYR